MKVCTKKPAYDIKKWIDKYVIHLQQEEVSDNTLKIYTSLLNKFYAYIAERRDLESIKDIDAYFISSYIEDLEEKHREAHHLPVFSYAYKTKSLYIIILKTLFDFIEDGAELEADGARFSFSYEFKTLTQKKRGRKAQKAKKLKHLTNDEVDNLIHHLDLMTENRQRHYDYIYALAIKIMLYAGLRASEALSLKLEDIHTFISSNGDEVVEFTLRDTKSGEEQYVPIKKAHIASELDYTESIENREDTYLICNKQGRGTIDRTNLYKVVKRIFTDAGIQKSGLHILRHTSAMMLLDKTKDITYVKELLRHSNITTTMIYVQRSTQQLGERVV